MEGLVYLSFEIVLVIKYLYEKSCGRVVEYSRKLGTFGSMDEFLSTESISLVAVSPLQAYELRNEDPGSPTRLRNDEKKDRRCRCILMAASQDQKDELNRIKDSEEGAIDLKDECGCSAIHYAARDNNAHVISTLLDAGADVNLKGPKGSTALYIAAR